MRTFISIELPDAVKKNIESLVGEFKLNLTPIKWVDMKNLHVTLKFLGWVEDSKVEDVCKIAASTVKDVGAFNVRVESLGAFPTVKDPRVIWIGITEGADKMLKISDELEDALAKKGYRSEEREFTPHITIGRIKEKIDTEMLEKHLSEKASISFGGFTAEHVSVMKSTLTQKGPIYEECKRVMFK